MIPENIQFGGGVAESIFSPTALAAVLMAGILLLLLPRTKAIVPFLIAAISIPNDQIVLIGPLHFPMLRILLLFGFARLFWVKFSGKGEILSGRMNGVDKAVILLSVFIAVDGMLLWQESAAVIYQLGNFYTAIGTYLLLRFLIRNEEDMKRTIRTLACLTIVVAGFMTYEALTGRNLIYAALGGAHSFMQTAGERNDRIRAAGPFAHAILAGTFGGFMLPLFVGLWAKEKTGRMLMLLGALGAIIMAITANSSTALVGGLGGIGGLCFWPLRRHMRAVRWGIVGTLATGQLYMTSPVWHIISDIDLAGGSSSYHRYMLVDQCIRHFWVWALVGTKDYASWGWDAWDLSDQYVGTADTAGLIPLICFLAIIVLGFKYLGRMRRAAEKEGSGDRKQEFFIWALAASLFANVVAFFGIGYFDQTIVGWYALLAMIATVTLPVRTAELAQEAVPAAKPDLAFKPWLASGAVRRQQSIESQKQTQNAKTEFSQPEHTIIQTRLR